MLGLAQDCVEICSKYVLIYCAFTSETIAVRKERKSGHLSPRDFAHSIKINFKRHLSRMALFV